MKKVRQVQGTVFTLVAAIVCILVSGTVSAQSNKPNILIIMGDDVGIPNISAYSHGLMGYQTPNIDRIAAEGAMFTDYYGEQSCSTALTTLMPRGRMIPQYPTCRRWRIKMIHRSPKTIS